jgi:hypothetical protein
VIFIFVLGLVLVSLSGNNETFADSADYARTIFADSAIYFRRPNSAWNKTVDGTARKSVVMAERYRAVHHLGRSPD